MGGGLDNKTKFEKMRSCKLRIAGVLIGGLTLNIGTLMSQKLKNQ